MSEVVEFLRDVFEHAGGVVTHEPPVLRASFPEESALAELLGGREKVYVFETEHVDDERELVATGGHVLRNVESYLAELAPRVYVLAPATARVSQRSLGLSPGHGEKISLERTPALGYDLYVVYRLRYRSRELRDEVATVRVELRPGIAPGQPDDAHAEVCETPAHALTYESRPRKRVPAKSLQTALNAADVALEKHARAESRELQDELRRGAKKDLTRLHAYYAGQIAEYMRRRQSDLNVIRVEELEEERALRVKELVEQAEVKVEVEPLQLLTVERPLQRLRVVRLDKETGEELSVSWMLFDRVDGTHEVAEPLEGEALAAAEAAVKAASAKKAKKGAKKKAKKKATKGAKKGKKDAEKATAEAGAEPRSEDAQSAGGVVDADAEVPPPAAPATPSPASPPGPSAPEPSPGGAA